MKTTNPFVTCLAAVVAAVGTHRLCAVQDAPDELVITFSGTALNIGSSWTDKVWTNRTEGSTEKIAWIPGSVCVMPEGVASLSLQNWVSFDCCKWLNEGTGIISFNGSGTLKTGAGGIVFEQAGALAFGYYTASPSYSGDYTALQLTADQIWDGRNASGTSTISIGYADGWKRSYGWSYVKAADGVDALTVKGNLAAFFYSPRNDLSEVDVRVESPARIYLTDYTVPASKVSEGYVERTQGRLNAKSVTFSGDGALTCFGSVSPVKEKRGDVFPKTVSVVNAETLAPSVTLENGADIVMTNVVFDLPSLAVTGQGTSKISGSSMTLVQPVTTFDVDESSRLEIDVDLFAVAGAGVAVAGSGTLAIGKCCSEVSVFEVGRNATLEFTGEGGVFAPVTGAGSVKVCLGDDETFYIDDLSEYTGTLEVTGGTLCLPRAMEGRITPTGAGTVVYGSDRYIGDETAADALIRVGAGETLVVGGNGLAAGTTVWLNGGTLRFERSAVVAATVTQDVSSVIEVVSTNTQVTFSGPIRVLSADTAVANTLSVYGGEVRITGGLRTETEKDQLYLYSGTLCFSGTEGYFSGNFGCPSQSKATGLVFDGVKYTSLYSGTGSPTPNIGMTFSPSVNAVCAIVNGATLAFEDSRCLFIGNLSTVESRLLVDGGTLKTDISWGTTQFKGKSSFDFRSGLFQFKRPVVLYAAGATSTDKLDFRWYGGTLRPRFDGERKIAGESYIFRWPYNSSYGRFPISVCGPDCVLDLSGLPADAVVTNAPVSGNAVWSGNEEGRLTVKGPAGIVFNNLQPEGFSLVLGERADVRLPASEQTVSFGELAVAATNGTISAGSGTAEAEIATLRVADGGWWHPGLLDGFASASVGDAVFEDGAFWRMTADDAAALSVTGRLTLSGSVRYRVEGGTAHSFTAAIAPGGVVAPSLWIRDRGRLFSATVLDTSVLMSAPGTVILFR